MRARPGGSGGLRGAPSAPLPPPTLPLLPPPQAESYDLLRSVGVTHFVDLTAPGESAQPYDAAPATYARHPITDFGIPSVQGLRDTLADIQSHVDEGGLVYVHCRAGVGRTGTVAACVGIGDVRSLSILPPC